MKKMQPYMVCMSWMMSDITSMTATPEIGQQHDDENHVSKRFLFFMTRLKASLEDMCQGSLCVVSISFQSFGCFVEQQRMFVLHRPCRDYLGQHLYIYIHWIKIRETKPLAPKSRELFTYTIATDYLLNPKIILYLESITYAIIRG